MRACKSAWLSLSLYCSLLFSRCSCWCEQDRELWVCHLILYAYIHDLQYTLIYMYNNRSVIIIPVYNIIYYIYTGLEPEWDQWWWRVRTMADSTPPKKQPGLFKADLFSSPSGGLSLDFQQDSFSSPFSLAPALSSASDANPGRGEWALNGVEHVSASVCMISWKFSRVIFCVRDNVQVKIAWFLY